MAPVKHALIDLVMNDETSRYIGHLERKVLRYTLEDMKMRALLELLTGDMWDDTDFHNMEEAEIQRIAVDTMKRRLQMSDADARKVVMERWQGLNQPAADEATSTYLFGPKPKTPPHTVMISRPITPTNQTLHYDHKKHLEGLEQAAKNRDARRNQT